MHIQLCCASRVYHSQSRNYLILSRMGGIPFLALEYNEKSRGRTEEMDRMEGVEEVWTEEVRDKRSVEKLEGSRSEEEGEPSIHSQ